MWQGSVELLMPGRRCQRPCSNKRRISRQEASPTVSNPWNTRSITRRLHELQLLSQRLLQEEVQQQPEPSVQTLRKIQADAKRPACKRRAQGHHEARSLPAAPDTDCRRGVEISIEFLVAKQNRRGRLRKLKQRRQEELERPLSVRKIFPLLSSGIDRFEALAMSEATSLASLRGSKASGTTTAQFIAAPQSSRTAKALECVRKFVESTEISDLAVEVCGRPLSENTLDATAATGKKLCPVTRFCSESEWLPTAIEDFSWPQECQAHCHTGPRPAILRIVLAPDLFGSFASNHCVPMHVIPPSASNRRQQPVSPQQFCWPLELANSRLAPIDKAVAVARPRTAVELGICVLHQFAGLLGSAPQCSTLHRLVSSNGGFIRACSISRFLNVSLTIVMRFGMGPSAVIANYQPEISAGAAELVSVDRCRFQVASHHLRLSVRQVNDPGVRNLRPVPPVTPESRVLKMTSPTFVGFGRVAMNASLQPEEPEKPSGSRKTPAGDVGDKVAGFYVLNLGWNSASGDDKRQIIEIAQENNSNVNDLDPPDSRDVSGCWDYVYLKSDIEHVQLVELHDTQEHRSTASTVIGVVGFQLPIFLAVPMCLLPDSAFPVISGNVIELGDWDLNCAEPMSPTAKLTASGYVFFEARVSSSYCDEEDVEFRVAIVVQEAGTEGPVKFELFAWEGGFVRRMSEYKQRNSFMLFGQPGQLLELSELPAKPPQLPGPVKPGWLTDRDHAMLLLHFRPPTLQESWVQLLDSPMGVELSAKSAKGTSLTPNLRGPFLMQGTARYSPPLNSQSKSKLSESAKSLGFSHMDVMDDQGGLNWVCLAKAAESNVEFVQQVPLDSPVSFRFSLHFHNSREKNCESCVEAVATLMHPMVTLNSPELRALNCDLIHAKSTEHIGQLSVDVRLVHCSQTGPLDMNRFLDRCGAAAALADSPIIILPMPAQWLSPMGPDAYSAATSALAAAAPSFRYFELPIRVSEAGVLRTGGGVQEQLRCQELCQALPTDARLIARAVLDDPASVNVAADALLASLLPAAERCVLVACHDLQLCLTLSVKQARLPLAFLAASVAEAVAELGACKHYGVRAVAAPAEELLGGRASGRTLLELTTFHGIALYVYGGGSHIRDRAASFGLEGVFGDGTVATSAQ